MRPGAALTTLIACACLYLPVPWRTGAGRRALAASPGAEEGGGDLPPRRDLFGTRGGGKKRAGRDEPDGRVRGTIELSNGESETGRLWLTADLGMTFYDTAAKEWREVELSELSRIDARPRAEELDKEWRWKEAGRDEKVYTGRTRPRRWLDHDVTLADGTRFTGHIKGTPIYIETDPEPAADKKAEAKPKRARPTRKRLVMLQYQRGDWGQTLKDLIYVKSIRIENIVVERPEEKAAPKVERAKAPRAEPPTATE
ncbi:MAG: hypothetical protein ACYSU0_03545 [Planctomycetota bacterium]|jgi:hypothetical protein